MWGNGSVGLQVIKLVERQTWGTMHHTLALSLEWLAGTEANSTVPLRETSFIGVPESKGLLRNMVLEVNYNTCQSIFWIKWVGLKPTAWSGSSRCCLLTAWVAVGVNRFCSAAFLACSCLCIFTSVRFAFSRACCSNALFSCAESSAKDVNQFRLIQTLVHHLAKLEPSCLAAECDHEKFP